MNSTVQLYDATLRDGMGGGGMSLTAQEKLRVVERLDELGVDMIEAGFPSSNPKKQSSSSCSRRHRSATPRSSLLNDLPPRQRGRG